MLKVRAEKRLWNDSIDLLIVDKTDSVISYASKLTMTKSEPGRLAEPTLTLTADMAQSLIDDLWQCGLRPSEGTGSAGALAATQNHLSDMRKLAFDLSDVVLKKAAE